MKFLKSFLIIFLILVLFIGVAIFVFIKTFDLDKYKELITEHLSDALQRQVTIETLKFRYSASKGIILEAVDVDIEDLVNIKSTYLQISIDKYLKSKEIDVSKIIIHEPDIKLTQSYLSRIDGAAKRNEVQVDDVGNKSKQQSKRLTHEVNVRKVVIKEGKFHYTDDLADDPVDIKIVNLNAEITDFSFNRSFAYKLSCAVFPQHKESFKLAGKAIIFSATQKVRLHDLNVDLFLNRIPLEEVYKNVPALAASGLDYISEGQLSLRIDQMLFEGGVIYEVTANGHLSGAKVHVKQVPSPIEIDAQFNLDEANIELNQYNIGLAGGSIKGRGDLTDYPSAMKFSIEAEMKKIALNQLMDQQDAPVRIKGFLSGPMELSGQGFDNKALVNFLNGKGQFVLKDGRLVDFNLLKNVLEKMSVFPHFVDDLRANLSAEYKERLDQQDTMLNDARLSVQITAGRMVMDDLKVNADGFVYSAKGDMDFQLVADIESSFYLAEDLSGSMIQTEEELTALLDEYRQIHIPFNRYQGLIAKYKPIPDLVNLIQQSIKSRGEDELKKALRKAFDIDEEPKQQQNTEDINQAPTENTEKKDANAEEVLIDTLIETLPIFK